MAPQYLVRLPPDVRSVIENIERESGTEIAVTPDPKRSDTLACNIECNGAEILVPVSDYFPPGAILHELLHIRRMYLDGVARIVFCEDCDDYAGNLPREQRLRSSLVVLDNNLEHLVIVPEELALRPERRSHWEKRMGKTLDALASGSLDIESGRYGVVEHWPFIHHVLPTSGVVSQIQALGEELGVIDRAMAFCEEIIPTIGLKEDAVRVWMKHFPGYENIVCFKYYDILNCTCLEVHVK